MGAPIIAMWDCRKTQLSRDAVQCGRVEKTLVRSDDHDAWKIAVMQD